jgi:hypothetical protein
VRHAAALVALALALSGCGAESADLFAVKRSGADRNANVRLVVNDGGTVTCNDQAPKALPGDELLEARDLARDLEKEATLSIDLPPGPDAVLRYDVRTSTGAVAFSDTSRGRPKSFIRLEGFTAKVIEDVCGIERTSA